MPPTRTSTPLPPAPSDQGDDETWAEMNRIWAAEALEQKDAEERRAEVIQQSLVAARERRAAEFAAAGQLAPSEPSEPAAPTAAGP